MARSDLAVTVVTLALLAGGGYLLYRKFFQSAASSYRGLLQVNGSLGPITTSSTATLVFNVNGMIPGDLIQIYFSTTPTPGQGQMYMATSGTANSSGAVTLSYTLTGATSGQTFWILAYDTSYASVAGFSNAVQITD